MKYKVFCRKFVFSFKIDDNYWASCNTIYSIYTLFLSQLFATCVYMWVQDILIICSSSSFWAIYEETESILLLIIAVGTHSNKFVLNAQS